jgi:hypothetical protein
LTSPDSSGKGRPPQRDPFRERPWPLRRLYWPVLRRGDIAGIILAAVIVIVAIVALVVGHKVNQKTNYGFGPEWDCVNPGKASGVTCIKQSPKTDTSK